MAATDPAILVPLHASESAQRSAPRLAASQLFLAAAAAVLATPVATAQTQAPETGVIQLRGQHYADSQPDIKRVTVNAPSAWLLTPIGSNWSLEASLVHDEVSGASPRYHSFTDRNKYPTSGASRMEDERTGADFKITRYNRRSAWALSYAYSSENDYKSNAVGAELRLSSEDNNRTWTFGVGASNDKINPTRGGLRNVRNEKKDSNELLFGVTQVLSRADIVQANVSYSKGKGFYTDPYKLFDNRPRNRKSVVLLTRWNHHFEQVAATLRSSYRYYDDSFGVRSHTVGLEWVQPFGNWTVTPNVRYYSQSAADFYFDPIIGPNGPDAVATSLFAQTLTGFTSADARLSAFGAVTVGLKLGVQIDKQWSADLKAERYEQRSNWRAGGGGSPGLDPLRANVFQLGIASKF